MNTPEAIQIVKAICRRLVKARINDCHRGLKRYNNKKQQLHDKLNQLIRTELLDTITTIAEKRASKATERARTGHQQKLTRLVRNKEQRQSKPDDNWVRNISSHPLDKNETRALSYGLKYSVTLKRIPTEAIVSSIEAALSRQRELPVSTKDNIRSRIAFTIQSASPHDSSLTKDERHALKRLRNDKDIVILPADKGRVTVVMDKTDYHDKMDAIVNDKQTYKELKRDPTSALQPKLNSTWHSRRHPTLLPTKLLSTTATETLWSAETTQTWFPNATYYFLLWFSDIPTVQVPNNNTTTAHRQIQTKTTIPRGLH